MFGLAQQSGGVLRVENALSRGTTAALWLPIAIRTSVPSDGLANEVTKASRRARILFVDDDFLIAGSTVAQLQDLGHEVIEAHSAREALQHLEGGCIQTF